MIVVSVSKIAIDKKAKRKNVETCKMIRFSDSPVL